MPSKKTTELSIPAPATLIDGDASIFLPQSEVSALQGIDRLIADTAVMISRTKGMVHAGIAGQALSGINLRVIREYYLGPRQKGRPAKTDKNAGFPRWKELLNGPFDISDTTADRWIKTGEAVMSLAEAQGTDLRTICAKLPWHWTPEETSFVTNTFQQLCKDKTQRQLMQADFLESLGFENKQDKHGTNNPGGKNGGKKKPAASPGALLDERRRLARLDFFGTENPGKIKPGSPVWHIEEFLKNPAEHPLSLLPKPELLDLIEHTLTPFIKALRKITA